MNFFVFLLLIICCPSKGFCKDDQYNKFMQASISQGLHLFTGLAEVLKYFRQNETSPISQQILHTFENVCLNMRDISIPSGRQRKPFIVIEGNHRPSREIIGMRLGKIMGGKFLKHPAPCLAKLMNVVPKGTLLRRAFYMLSVYAQAVNAKIHLSLGRTVILNGYWWDQLVFHVVQSFDHGPMPNATSHIFDFPEDLLAPDVIYYLDIPDTLRVDSMTTRSPLNWKPRAMQLYKDLQSRYPIVFERLAGVNIGTTHAIYKHVHEHLAETRSLWPERRSKVLDYEGSVQPWRNDSVARTL